MLFQGMNSVFMYTSMPCKNTPHPPTHTHKARTHKHNTHTQRQYVGKGTKLLGG